MSQGRVCVVGAGTSGLAMCRELSRRGIDYDCVERGSEVGGNWRIDGDGGAAAYRSLRTNVSRRRMQYPSLPMPRSYGDFVSQADMAAYLASYADHHGLRAHIRLRTAVESAVPRAGGGWTVTLRPRDGAAESVEYTALVVATGKDATPSVPDIPGQFDGRSLHSRCYRSPEPFRGERVLVVGAGNSGCDIASEVSEVAALVDLVVRRGVHVLPRHLFGRPVDALNGPLSARLPWPVPERGLELMLRLARGDYARYGWPKPDHHALSGVPTVSSTILAAVRDGRVGLRPGIARFDGSRVHFDGGATAGYDTVIFATGYRLAFPFLDPDVSARLEVAGNTLPLYRHIVPPHVRDLYFIGICDPHAGHPPVVEAQAAWIADAFTGRIAVPSGEVDPPQRRVQRRYVHLQPNSLVVDRFGYPRQLRADRRRPGRRARRPGPC